MRRLLIAFVALGALLALLQFAVMRHALPPPDGIAYFEVADQIPLVGYGRALPIHWSPLYPIYLLAGRALFGGSIDRELTRTAAGDALLLAALCLVVALVFRSLARLCWPGALGTRRAWAAYACGLSLYCAFALLRVGLRMPDAIVTSLVAATLWAWCRAMSRDLDWRWCVAAGLLSGTAFLTRANLLHWSLVTATLACIVAPSVTPRRRVAAGLAFALGLAVLFVPHAWALSSARGTFTFGETGKIVFAQSYGAEYDAGFPAWPVRLNDGDVRIFTEDRALNFPGFYDIGREFDDAKILRHWWKLPWALIRNGNSCLFGNWSTSFALFWPFLWGLWPFALFELYWRRGAFRSGLIDPRALLRQRISWLLILAGAAGVAMHLVSLCNAYYLPPYIIALLTGASLRVLDSEHDSELRHRAAWLASAGFVLIAVLATAQHYRASERTVREADLKEEQAVAAVLTRVFPSENGVRKVAVEGQWLGLYSIRLSGSELVADIPTTDVLHDRARAVAAASALRARGVVALLVRRVDLMPGDLLQPAALTRTWAIVDLRGAP